jgi:hypothetical protein
MRLPAARPIPISARTTDLQIAGGLTLLLGWSFRETTAAAGATFRLVDGTETGGAIVASITLTSNESTRDLIPAPGLACMSGLFLDVIAGEIEGSIWALEATQIGGLAFADGPIPWPAYEG